jgi:hypothetical protein
MFIFVFVGMRIIISEKKNLPVDGLAADKSEPATSPPSSSSSSSYGKDDEEAAVWRVYSIVCGSLNQGSGSSCEWVEDKTRFKDYVTAPKLSG